MSDPVEYAPMASTGSSKCTEKNRQSARTHFDFFCASKHLPPWKELSEGQFCHVTLFREFSIYLAEHALVAGSKMLPMAGSAVQYLDVIKELAILRFPENEIPPQIGQMVSLFASSNRNEGESSQDEIWSIDIRWFKPNRKSPTQ